MPLLGLGAGARLGEPQPGARWSHRIGLFDGFRRSEFYLVSAWDVYDPIGENRLERGRGPCARSPQPGRRPGCLPCRREGGGVTSRDVTSGLGACGRAGVRPPQGPGPQSRPASAEGGPGATSGPFPEHRFPLTHPGLLARSVCGSVCRSTPWSNPGPNCETSDFSWELPFSIHRL